MTFLSCLKDRMTKRKRHRIKQLWGTDKAKTLTAQGNLILRASSVPLRFKPAGNKAKLACQCWVEGGTIQGQGCPSDVKEGMIPALYFYGSLGPLMCLYIEPWKKWKTRGWYTDILLTEALYNKKRQNTRAHMHSQTHINFCLSRQQRNCKLRPYCGVKRYDRYLWADFACYSLTINLDYFDFFFLIHCEITFLYTLGYSCILSKQKQKNAARSQQTTFFWLYCRFVWNIYPFSWHGCSLDS